MSGACVPEAGTGRLCSEAGGTGTKGALLDLLLAAEEAPPPGQEPVRSRKAARCWLLHVVHVVRRGAVKDTPPTPVVCSVQN